jgi:hypothetical protein
VEVCLRVLYYWLQIAAGTNKKVAQLVHDYRVSFSLSSILSMLEFGVLGFRSFYLPRILYAVLKLLSKYDFYDYSD